MRVLDISLSFIALIVLSPILLAAAVLVYCSSRGPVFYRAVRVGKDGRLFNVLKFRTMVVDAGGRGPRVTAQGDRRITAVGRFLRASKIDEWPQLVNVLRGEMNLVGPRPEDPHYVRLYSPAERQVLRVRPGITSPATIMFRHEEQLLTGLDWEIKYCERILPRKLAIELEYLSRRTLARDVGVLLRTALALFVAPGVPHVGTDQI